jgi:hypothetical protein
VIAAASALGACGLTADFSGLEDGGRAPDAGRDATTLVDASAGEDAGSGEDVQDGVRFCALLTPQPKFCADFDEGFPVATGWTQTDETANATVTVDSIGYESPAAMLSKIVPADVPASARLEEDFPATASQVHIEFEALLTSGGGPFELAALHEQAPDGTDYGVFYKEQDGSLLVYVGSLADDGGLAQYVYQLGAPPQTWLHVSIDVVIAESGSLVVKHDGAVVVNETGIDTLTDGRTRQFVEMGFYSPNAATAQADFDDVIIDWP